MEPEFSGQIFLKKKRKNLNIKFHKNASSASRVVACGPTDRHEETNSRSTHFANPPEKKSDRSCECLTFHFIYCRLINIGTRGDVLVGVSLDFINSLLLSNNQFSGSF